MQSGAGSMHEFVIIWLRCLNHQTSAFCLMNRHTTHKSGPKIGNTIFFNEHPQNIWKKPWKFTKYNIKNMSKIPYCTKETCCNHVSFMSFLCARPLCQYLHFPPAWIQTSTTPSRLQIAQSEGSLKILIRSIVFHSSKCLFKSLKHV